MEGELQPLVTETPLGEAEVRAVFGSGTRRAAGCMVTDGHLRADCLVKVRCCLDTPGRQTKAMILQVHAQLHGHKRAPLCTSG